MANKQPSLPYRLIRAGVQLCYPKIRVVGSETLPDCPVVIVGNHAKMNGPIACELYYPRSHSIWSAGPLMHPKETPDYAYQDFWARKPKHIRWMYRLISYLITPLAVCVFRNANTIGVYHDARLLSTFRQTLEQLKEGRDIIIFPEHDVPYNKILCQFQDKFVDVAKLYYKKTGIELSFIPLYVAPALKTLFLGVPIRFRADAPIEDERARICEYLMTEITKLAGSLPKHAVVPYNNIPKKQYPTNLPEEDMPHENTCC